MVNELYGTPETPGEGFDELLARLEADAGITPPHPGATNGKAKDSDPLPDGFERIGASVFDRLTESITWADILEPLGWQSVRAPDAATAEAWKRPGGTHPVSAKVLKAAPYILVNWSEDSGLPVGAGQKITMARALAHFHYSRNESALAKDLIRGQARGVPANVNDAIRTEWSDRRPVVTLDTGEQINTETGEVSGTEPDLAAGDFWNARDVLQHIHRFARARRVGPWALFGILLVRTAANIPANVVLPPLVGGHASLNPFVALVGASGGGKGSAENAASDAMDLEPVPTYGPGSGEGIAHLFATYNKNTGKIEQHTPSVILSAAEVNTLAALKSRQASTLLPELRKAWTGEPLGFGYVDNTKRLNLGRHRYRLGLVVGVQPEEASALIDDKGAGTPQRLGWMPADDLEAPEVAPSQPAPWHWHNPWRGWMASGMLGQQDLEEIRVCQTARDHIDQARLARLRGQTGDDLDGHALLCQEKVAAILALWDKRKDINDDDWRLAGIVRQVSDRTREHVINTLQRAKAQQNRARGMAEADRAVVVDQRRDEAATQRVGRSIVGKLQREGGWLGHNKLKHSLATKYRQHFEEVITSLIELGQVEERATQADHAGHQGTEYRKVGPRR
jgi:hypothetical protein